MRYELGDIFELGENTFMVAETLLYLDVDYLLLNKLDNEEEPTNELYIYKVVENGLIKVTDQKLLETLAPIFENKVLRDINKIEMEEKYNIN